MYAYASSEQATKAQKAKRDTSEESIKQHDQALDALRYALHSELGQTMSADAYLDEMRRWLELQKKERDAREPSYGYA